MKCNHKWIGVNDMTTDKICSICGIRAMQASLSLAMPNIIDNSLNVPSGKENNTFVFNNNYNKAVEDKIKTELIKRIMINKCSI